MNATLPTLAVTLIILAFAGCARSGPDYTPIGDGLKAIGISLVVFGVVGALADLIRSESDKPADHKPKRPPRSGGRRSFRRR